MNTGIVAPEDPDDDAPFALPDTAPIRLTTPVVIWLSGNVISTLAPTLIVDWPAASRLTWTCGTVEVACAMTVPGTAFVPSVALTCVIRTGPGRNTTSPRGSEPLRGSPTLACSFETAMPVEAVKT